MNLKYAAQKEIDSLLDSELHRQIMSDIINKQMKATNDTLEKYCRMFTAPKIK